MSSTFTIAFTTATLLLNQAIENRARRLIVALRYKPDGQRSVRILHNGHQVGDLIGLDMFEDVSACLWALGLCANCQNLVGDFRRTTEHNPEEYGWCINFKQGGPDILLPELATLQEKVNTTIAILMQRQAAAA